MIIIAVGGYIDLSVGYCATLVACFTAGMMDGKNSNIWKAIIFAIMIGIIVGLVNGVFSVYLKIPSIVVTMAVSQILQGIVDLYSSRSSLSGKPSPWLQRVVAKNSGSIPNNFILLLIVTIVVLYLFYKTKLAYKLTACGSNEVTAHLSGVHVKRTRMFAFIACDVIAAMMGLMVLGNLGQAFKDMASAYVMPSIAAVAIGGLNINGGSKNFIGVILGAMVLQILTNMFVALGLGDSGRYLGSGVILLIMLILYVGEKANR